MKFLVNFSKQIGLEPIEKEVNSNETLQNLQCIISLNYEQMDKAKIVYKGNALKDKQKKLRDIFPHFQPEITHQIWVTKKGDMDFVSDIMSKGNNLATTNPILVAGVVIGVIFLLLAIVGNMS